MRPVIGRLLCQTIVLTLALGFVACTDTENPLRPPVRALYTTPTGLLTANPPQIFVGAGDISSCSNTGDEQTAKLLDAIPDPATVYNIGDDAYNNGTTSEFNNCYGPTWGRHKYRTKPTPGNHEYNSSGAAPYYAYFGAAAGPSGRGYYSYDLGAWHILSLNSNVSSSSGSAQDTWLRADLAAHPNQCILAYYHHPLYSSTATYSSSRGLVNALYAYHADLILNGHRHYYEREKPLDPTGKVDLVNGYREIIAGTGGIGGGSTGSTSFTETSNGSTFGVLKLYLYDDSYAWKFIPVAGKTYTDSGSAACHSSGGGGGGGVSASNSTVAASPTSFTAGAGSSTITVTAKDGTGNTISGASVSLTSSGSGNSLTPSSGTTNSSGVFTSTLTSTVAESKTVSATINGTAITQTAAVTVNPASPVSASNSSVGAAPASFAAGGSSTITVTVNDGSGNPLNGITVSLSATGSGNTITQPATATNSSGVTTGTFSSTGAGPHTITAVAGGVTLNQQPVVTVTAGTADAGQSTVSAQPTSIVVGTGSSTITVTVKDAFGNPISGSNVVLAATGSGNTLTGGGTTNASGVASGALSSTVVESKTVSATADGVAITQTATVTVTNQPPPGITHTLLTSGHDPTNTSTFTTASISPAANALVTVAVLTHQSAAAAPDPTLTGAGMTWQVVASVAYDGATPLDRLTIFRAMSSAPGSGPITIKTSVTVSNCQWIVSQWGGVDQSGTNGSGAIVQTRSATGAAVTTLTASLAAFASPNDVAYGVFGVANATAVITAGAGFTTIDQQPSGESTVGDLFAEWAVNLPAVTATWPSKPAGALGVEIKAGP
ncbi:MAG TPA: invasin domain 3-containing protein [Gemmatimonadales bacterium]|nr:invasin domain 3-containing protein [Gemmatimonadales bacterium]